MTKQIKFPTKNNEHKTLTLPPLPQIKVHKTIERINSKRFHTSLHNKPAFYGVPYPWHSDVKADIHPCQAAAGHMADSSPVSYLFAQLRALKAEQKQQTVDFFYSFKVNFKAA